MFTALLLNQENKQTVATFERMERTQLPPGDVTVQLRPSGRHNMIQITEDAMCTPITPQYRREQKALASAAVDQVRAAEKS